MDAQQPSPSSRDRLSLAMTPAQVIALGLVAASMGWAVWLLRDRPTSEEVELLAGMALPSSEMAIMEAAFDRAQLTDHRTDGGRVWVPRSRQSAYMRALVDAEALPREFGGSLRRALEKNSPWQSKAVQGELLRVATQEELSLVICSMPGIERAAVLYDTESHHSLEGGGPAKTASVNVRTQPDMELDPARVQAIRVLVSASIAGLSPERVAVTDLRSGRVYVGPLEAVADREMAAIAGADPALAKKIAHEHHLASKVRQSLSFLKGATVDVSVEFDGAETDAPPLPPGPESLQVPVAGDLNSSPQGPTQKPADANAPAEIRPRSAIIVASPPPQPTPAQSTPAQPQPGRGAKADMPGAILVSIAVPDSYFQSACRAAAERAGQPALQPIAIEAQEMERIRRHVLSLLPATRDPAQRRVIITSFPVAGPSQARREPAGRFAAGVHGSAASAAPTVGRTWPGTWPTPLACLRCGHRCRHCRTLQRSSAAGLAGRHKHLRGTAGRLPLVGRWTPPSLVDRPVAAAWHAAATDRLVGCRPVRRRRHDGFRPSFESVCERLRDRPGGGIDRRHVGLHGPAAGSRPRLRPRPWRHCRKRCCARRRPPPTSHCLPRSRPQRWRRACRPDTGRPALMAAVRRMFFRHCH
jgi:type III secretory pathway lipoprotein EscJ